MNIKISVKISKFDFKKNQVNQKIKDASTYRKASLPNEFNSDDLEWVEGMNGELPTNEKIQTPSDLKNFDCIVSHSLFNFLKDYMAEKNSEQQRNFYEKLERVAIELKEKEDGPEKDLIRLVLEDKLDVDFDLYNLDSFSNSDEGIIANATGWISEKKVSYPVNRGFLISNSKIEFAKELILEIQQKLTLYFEFYEGRKEVLENILNEKETKSKNFEERLTEKDKEFLKEIQDTELFKKTFNEIRQEFIDQMSKCTDVDEEGKNKCLKELTQSFLPFDLDIWITKATLYKLKKDNAPVPKWLTATVKVKITVKNK